MTSLRYLTEEQWQSYQTNGYLVIENFSSSNQICNLKSQILKIIDNTDPSTVQGVFATGVKQLEQVRNDYFISSSDKVRLFFESKAVDAAGNPIVPLPLAINKIGHALHLLDPVFSNYTHDKRFREIALDLGIKRPVVPQSMYIFKQPHTGGEVTPHQDSSFLYTTPLSCTAMWIPLDDATIRNGCLWVIPGTHNEPVRHRFKAKEDKSGCFYEPAIDEEKFKEIWPKDKFLPLEVKAGSLVILHGSVAHMSEDNTSPNGRNVYTFHIVDGEAQWAPENWLQYPNGSPFEDL